MKCFFEGDACSGEVSPGSEMTHLPMVNSTYGYCARHAEGNRLRAAWQEVGVLVKMAGERRIRDAMEAA